MKAIKAILKWFFILIGIGVAAIVAVAVVQTIQQQSSEPQVAASRPAAQPVAVAAPVAPPMPAPPDEVRFIEITRQGEADYRTGANEMQKGAARPKRAKAICGALRGLSVHGWLGTIETLSSNSDGKGVLGVRISQNTVLKTWNNSFSDIGSNTLIDPSSTLFAQASALKEGDPVVFSGTFFASQTDCAQEPSLTISGSMEDPDFVFRFVDIQSQ